jgi:hypothetical protein
MRSLLIVAAAFAAGLSPLVPDELRPETRVAFERYVKLTAERVQSEVAGRSPFLWIDRQAPADREEVLRKLSAGEVVVEKLKTLENGDELDVDGGMIHHWVGTVLIPGKTVGEVFAFIQQYDRYPEVFDPMIRRAKVTSNSGGRFAVSMRTEVHKVITVVMDVDYDIDYRRLGPSRGFSTNTATSIFEVHDAGQPNESRTPGDKAGGYLWRFQMWCSFDGRAEGTYEQCESISLTRGIPFGLGWIVGPFVNSIPRETLELTLGGIRDGLAG